ncbi:MAG: energy transducer TonB [Chromatiales bacterium]|nr:energy transducer TonB [Chromatiales bacterium]
MADGGRQEQGGNQGSRKATSVLRGYLPIAAISLAVISLVGALGWLVVSSMDDTAAPTKKLVQQVQIIRPPPPPETPPPPPPVPEEVDVPEPDEPEPEVAAADLPPAGDQLGLDAEGVAGADGFGLLGRKGGRDLLGAGSSDQYSWYGQVLKGDLIDKLAEIRDIRRDRYSVVVRLWLAPDGRIEKFKVASSTGDAALDRDLVAALESLGRVSELPPAGLPQPVRLRIVSRI